MRALSVQQPWAWAILRGGKTVENRYNVRGQEVARKIFNRPGITIALHASQRYAGEEAYRIVKARSSVNPAEARKADPAWAMGNFIGTVRLESVHTADACYDPRSGRFCSPWADEAAAHLVLADPRVLRRPVFGLGRLGMWQIDDTDLLAEIRRQVA